MAEETTEQPPKPPPTAPMTETTSSDIDEEGVTATAPAQADQSSYPNADDALPEQPPVRTTNPETPIAQSMSGGAGEHKPPEVPPEEQAGG